MKGAAVFSDEFDLSFEQPEGDDCAPWAEIVAILAERTDTTQSEAWVESVANEVLLHIVDAAPCKADEWITYCDLPLRVQRVLLAALVRVANNPANVRTVQMGEFSQTWASSSGASEGGNPLTEAELRIIRRESDCGQASGLYSIRLGKTHDYSVGFDPIPALEATRPRPEHWENRP